MLSQTEIAYLAGFFDGEGSVSISEQAPRPGKTRTPQFQLTVVVSNQCLDVIVNIYKEFQGSLGKGFGAYRVYLSSLQAKKFLETIQPYIKVKKEQIELALLFQEFRSSRIKGRTLSDEEIELGRLCRQRMKELNKRNSLVFHSKSGELQERLKEDNLQPSSSNGIANVDEKVHRLIGEDSQSNKPDKSARPERDDIVGTA